MKNLILTAAIIGLLTGHANAQESESIISDCPWGGQKSITYDWNIYNGAISYNVTLINCKLVATTNRLYNGSIGGSGTLLVNSDGFDTYVTTQEELAISGTDSGTISCSTGIQGKYTTATQAFAGTITKNNCTYTIGASDINLIDLLSQITFK